MVLREDLIAFLRECGLDIPDKAPAVSIPLPNGKFLTIKGCEWEKDDRLTECIVGSSDRYGVLVQMELI